jgi:NAD(P)H-quinone oxidoreductase subunit 5
VDVLSRVADWGDRYLIDGVVNLVGFASILGGEVLKYGNSGKTQFYVFTIAIGLAVIGVLMTYSFLTHLTITASL